MSEHMFDMEEQGTVQRCRMRGCERPATLRCWWVIGEQTYSHPYCREHAEEIARSAISSRRLWRITELDAPEDP